MYVACENKKCGNLGAPYAADTVEEPPPCPLCGKPMVEVEPDLSPPAVVEPPTDAELLDVRRGNVSSHVLSRLAWTDTWVVRSIEEDVPISAERVAYRQALRALLAEISKSKDPEKIEIPDPPAAPKAKG